MSNSTKHSTNKISMKATHCSYTVTVENSKTAPFYYFISFTCCCDNAQFETPKQTLLEAASHSICSYAKWLRVTLWYNYSQNAFMLLVPAWCKYIVFMSSLCVAQQHVNLAWLLKFLYLHVQETFKTDFVQEILRSAEQLSGCPRDYEDSCS